MSKLKLGVIGVGSVVREIYRHLYFDSRYAPMLDVQAVADSNPETLAGFCDQHEIPKARRFRDYREMVDKVGLDVVQVNTPDCFHRAPTVYALERGVDVLMPKPLAESIEDAHAMIATARQNDRLIVVDFHKRDDPRIREAASRYRGGVYGQFQSAVWYMLDRLEVADPNHEPRFFASPDFAEKNTPITFLTVHMVDAFIQIIREKPIGLRATAYSQKLPSLTPQPVNGYDLCDTEVVFESGGVAHIITGWHLPNSAHSITMQSSRIICTEGLIDLALDAPGCRETLADGITERNPLFRNVEPDGTVSGYAISHPGGLYEAIRRHRAGELSAAEYAKMMGALQLGYWATVVCEAAQLSLDRGRDNQAGVVRGAEIDVTALLEQTLGESPLQYI